MPDAAIHWTPLALHSDSSDLPTVLMLIGNDSTVNLLFTTSEGLGTPLWRMVLPGEQTPPTRITFAASEGTPSDAVIRQDGTLSLVLTRAGSARSQLFYRNAHDSNATYVNHLYNFGIFVQPRFIKHNTDALPPIVALGIIDGKSVPVVFQSDHGMDYGNYTLLPLSPDGRLQSVRLLRYKGGFLLLTKMSLPLTGPVSGRRPPPERIIEPGISVPLGVLYATLLNRSYHAVGETVKILGDTSVFEFDADARGDSILLLATTETGLVFANGLLERGVMPSRFLSTTTWQKPLTSPSLFANARRVYMTLLEEPGSKSVKVWSAEF